MRLRVAKRGASRWPAKAPVLPDPPQVQRGLVHSPRWVGLVEARDRAGAILVSWVERWWWEQAHSGGDTDLKCGQARSRHTTWPPRDPDGNEVTLGQPPGTWSEPSRGDPDDHLEEPDLSKDEEEP